MQLNSLHVPVLYLDCRLHTNGLLVTEQLFLVDNLQPERRYRMKMLCE